MNWISEEQMKAFWKTIEEQHRNCCFADSFAVKDDEESYWSDYQSPFSEVMKYDIETASDIKFYLKVLNEYDSKRMPTDYYPIIQVMLMKGRGEDEVMAKTVELFNYTL